MQKMMTLHLADGSKLGLSPLHVVAILDNVPPHGTPGARAAVLTTPGILYAVTETQEEVDAELKRCVDEVF